MSRITVAQVNARVDALVEAQGTTNELLAKLVAQVSAYATPAPVVEITQAKSAKKTARKSAPAKATVKATAKEVVTLEVAQARVGAGENAWKIFVASNTTGQPIPFGKVQRAVNAQARKDAPKAAKSAPTKAVKALGTPASVYFTMSRKALEADGSKGAQAELARRDAKKAAKSA